MVEAVQRVGPPLREGVRRGTRLLETYLAQDLTSGAPRGNVSDCGCQQLSSSCPVWRNTFVGSVVTMPSKVMTEYGKKASCTLVFAFGPPLLHRSLTPIHPRKPGVLFRSSLRMRQVLANRKLKPIDTMAYQTSKSASPHVAAWTAAHTFATHLCKVAQHKTNLLSLPSC